jgi:DNA-binding NarL/FixJ family response regulator
LTRIIFIGDQNAILIFEEETPIDSIILKIKNGFWHPPFLANHEQYQVSQHENTLFITKKQNCEKAKWHTHISEVEINVVYGLATGLTDPQIATENGIKPRTVQSHVDRMKLRLGAASREHLVAKAAAMGLFDLESIL